jgi:hypothetical protein
MKANIKSIIGKRFYNLLVLSFSHTSTAQHKDRVRVKYWFNCLCDCGAKTTVNKSCLTNSKGGTKSCGCLLEKGWRISANKQRGIPRPHMQKPNGESVLHASFLTYKGGAKKRNLKFELTKLQFAALTSQNCSYCNAEPKELKNKKDSFVVRKMNGIDRVNSAIGYTFNNCTPCCKVCNYMKQELSEQEFFDHLLKIKSFRDI